MKKIISAIFEFKFRGGKPEKKENPANVFSEEDRFGKRIEKSDKGHTSSNALLTNTQSHIKKGG